MKREDLKNLGLTDEQIEKVMAEHGKDITSLQEKVNGLYENGTVNMEFINQRMVKLPHTGSAKVLFMSVMGMFLMAKKLKEKE